MKMLSLEVKGFRSLYDVTWKPGDLNILIGPNASGKSNLLRLLEMLAASARGELSKYIQREGGLGALVWDDGLPMIGVFLQTAELARLILRNLPALDYRLELGGLGKVTYWIGREILGRPASQPLLERQSGEAKIWDDKLQGFVVSQRPVVQEETLLSTASGLFSPNSTIVDYREELGSVGASTTTSTPDATPL